MKDLCKWAISRPSNGISLNGREYVCDDDGQVLMFNSYGEAEFYLIYHCYDTARMEREGIEIIEMQDCGDHYEPIVR